MATTVGASDSSTSCKVIVLLTRFVLNFLFVSNVDVISSNVHPLAFILSLSTVSVI